MSRYFIIACLCVLLMACQHSPRKNYYYLTPTLEAEKTTTQHTNNTLQLIGIGPVEIAEYLTRSQIIDNQADNTLTMSENAYWAEPLDKSVTRVIALNLTQLNNSRSFVNFPWRGDSKPHYSLRLHIDNLSRSGKNASINATWELVDHNNKNTVVRHNFLRSLPAETGAKGLAQAYSQLLAELAKEMDEELNKNP